MLGREASYLDETGKNIKTINFLENNQERFQVDRFRGIFSIKSGIQSL